MFDKLRQIEERYSELNRSLSDPQVIGQPAVYARTAKAASELAETVAKFEEYKGVLARISEARHILADDADREMRELAETRTKWEKHKGGLARLSQPRHILAEDADREMRELAQAEVDELTARQ